MTSSPYWSQSNGCAEAAVKSAKHILLTAEDVDLALLSVRYTPPAEHAFSPAQRLFGRTLRSDLLQPIAVLVPFPPLRNKNGRMTNVQAPLYQTYPLAVTSMPNLLRCWICRSTFLHRAHRQQTNWKKSYIH